MAAEPVPPVTDNERDAREALEWATRLDSIAEFDRLPEKSYEAQLLRRLVAALSAATTERDEARAELAAAYGDTTSEWYTALDRERERAEALAAQLQQAREALRVLLDRYVGLVASGDCGFWDAEREDEGARGSCRFGCCRSRDDAERAGRRSVSVPAAWKINVPAAPMMDWPAAWQYIRKQHPDPAEHHPSCSWVQTNRALLCDCDVLWDEYVRRGGQDPRAAAAAVPNEAEGD